MIPEKKLLEKSADFNISRFQYFLLGIELKAQTDTAKKTVLN